MSYDRQNRIVLCASTKVRGSVEKATSCTDGVEDVYGTTNPFWLDNCTFSAGALFSAGASDLLLCPGAKRYTPCSVWWSLASWHAYSISWPPEVGYFGRQVEMVTPYQTLQRSATTTSKKRRSLSRHLRRTNGCSCCAYLVEHICSVSTTNPRHQHVEAAPN